MKNTFARISGSTVLFILGTSSAFAADLSSGINIPEATNSYYIAARIGAAFAEDSSFDLNAAAAVPTAINNDYEEASLMGAVAIGSRLNDNLRAEVELSFSKSDIDSHTIEAISATLDGVNAFGNTSTLTGLVNGYYDFSLGGFSPYVSAGLGVARVDFDNHGVVVPAGGVAGLPGGPITAMDDHSNAFAWQIGTGLNVELDSNTTMEIGYRYQSIENVKLTAIDGTETDVDFASHQVMAGFRVGF